MKEYFRIAWKSALILPVLLSVRDALKLTKPLQPWIFACLDFEMRYTGRILFLFSWMKLGNTGFLYSCSRRENRVGVGVCYDWDKTIAFQKGILDSAAFSFISTDEKGVIQSRIPYKRLWAYIEKNQNKILVNLCAARVKDGVGRLIGFLGIAKEKK
jgi:hypothetical protein